jgi:ribosomal protein L31
LPRRGGRRIRPPARRAAGPPGGSFIYCARDCDDEIRHSPQLPHDQGCHDQWRRVHDPIDLWRRGATLHLDIDPNTHPAWTGGSTQLLDRGGRLSRFNSRFSGLSIGGKK